MWTLILTLTLSTNTNPYIQKTHTVAIPNIPTKEICKHAGEQRIKKFNNSNYKYYVGVYTCVEQGK
jgi:hypothetical protein